MPDASVRELMQKAAEEEPQLDHFALPHVQRFLDCHSGRPGVAVLAFEVSGEGGLDQIAQAYAAQHAALLVPTDGAEGPVRVYGAGSPEQTRVLEVFAYYSTDDPSAADEGTVLRFVERGAAAAPGDDCVLPGLVATEAPVFLDAGVTSAYSDHWVSNVVDRTGFLDTLNDTLGFSPKVDFNAGVVAAGEAIIESTVTGNAPAVEITDREEMLVNQQQVYLPTNNALSSVGHVHLFIEQLGQGVQHLASRVPDLVAFIQRANTLRSVTQSGLVFLTIPRSYYGRLTLSSLEDALDGCESSAARVLTAVEDAELVDGGGIVELDVTAEEVAGALAPCGLTAEAAEAAVGCVRRARYGNLYNLLRDHLTEAQYIEVVRNQILVDIQGEDCLYQIFTAPVLQAAAGEEAPFLEFIERVCSSQCGADGCTPLPVKCAMPPVKFTLSKALELQGLISMMCAQARVRWIRHPELPHAVPLDRGLQGEQRPARGARHGRRGRCCHRAGHGRHTDQPARCQQPRAYGNLRRHDAGRRGAGGAGGGGGRLGGGGPASGGGGGVSAGEGGGECGAAAHL